MLAKKTLGAVLALAALSGIGTAAHQAEAAPGSFVLSCRGGGAMTFDVRSVGEKVRLEVRFAKATAGATATAPGAGQCAWLDRPLNGGEPVLLHLSQKGEVQVACNAKGQCGVGVVPKDIRAIIDTIRNGGTFLVHVYNNGTGYLEITKVGP